MLFIVSVHKAWRLIRWSTSLWQEGSNGHVVLLHNGAQKGGWHVTVRRDNTLALTPWCIPYTSDMGSTTCLYHPTSHFPWNYNVCYLRLVIPFHTSYNWQEQCYRGLLWLDLYGKDDCTLAWMKVDVQMWKAGTEEKKLKHKDVSISRRLKLHIQGMCTFFFWSVASDENLVCCTTPTLSHKVALHRTKNIASVPNLPMDYY